MSLENDLEILEKEYRRLDKKYKDKLSGANRAVKITAGIVLILLALVAIDFFFSTLTNLIPEIAKFLLIFSLILITMGIGIYYVASLSSADIKRVRVRAEAENRIEDEMEKKMEVEK
jgi:uncharacterized YccA/Bax inhibitor family protein